MQKVLSLETCCNRQSPGSSTGQLFPILHYSWRSDSPPPKGFRLLNPSGFRVHLAAMNRETTFLTPLSNYSEPPVEVPVPDPPSDSALLDAYAFAVRISGWKHRLLLCIGAWCVSTIFSRKAA